MASSASGVLWIHGLLCLLVGNASPASEPSSVGIAPPPPPSCSRTYIGRPGGPGGYITSPNYPFDYADNMTCRHVIYVGGGVQSSTPVVCLTFRRFGLENSSPFCSFDYVELPGGGPTESPLRIKYCGNGLWQYGVEEKGNPLSNVWSSNLCWPVHGGSTFEMKFSSDNTINGSGFYAMYNVYNGTSSSGSQPPSIAPEQQAPCGQTEWVCFNRRCINRTQLCDGVDDCGDDSDESYAHARCAGSQAGFACDFTANSGATDGYCGLTHNGWHRTSGAQAPFGPSGDHTNGSAGFYLFADGQTSPVYLTSPTKDLPSGRSFCLSFYYFVASSPLISAASLFVYISTDQAMVRPEWSRRDQTGSGGWKQAEVSFVLHSPLQVTFAAVIGGINGTSGGNEKLALDDISLQEGDCSGVDVSCNFESSFCGWSSVRRPFGGSGAVVTDVDWTLRNRTSSPATDLTSDHSSVDGSGNYASARASKSSSGLAFLVSPGLSALPGDRQCVQFWFATGSAQLLVHVYNYNDVISTVWNQSSHSGGAWTRANVDIMLNGPFQIVFQAVLSASDDSYVAIDELTVSDGACVTIDGSCGAGQYHCIAESACIYASLLCDGTPHCLDGSDEDYRAGCVTTTVEPPSTLPGASASTVGKNGCPSSSFRCENTSICIPPHWLCDRINDCGDYSDEGPLAGCVGADVLTTTVRATPTVTTLATSRPTVPMVCLDIQFTCITDGACVSLQQRCDGVADCSDQSDEFDCAAVTPMIPFMLTCSPGEFACHSQRQCIASRLMCDGQADCADGSDEAQCPIPGTKLSSGAIAGIVIGGCLSLLLLCIVAVVFVCRRRQKPTQRAQQRCTSSRSTTSVSTISAGNGTTVPHVTVNGSVSMRGGGGGASLQRNRDNAGYSHRDSFAPSHDEPPPPYSSLNRAAACERSRDAAAVGFSRTDRRNGRSLPPTPTRVAPAAVPPQRLRDSFSDHIYDEPTTLLRDCPIAVVQPAGINNTPGTMTSFPRSSTSRIRLGTTALRPGSARCNSPLSPASSSTCGGPSSNAAGGGHQFRSRVQSQASPLDVSENSSQLSALSPDAHPFYIANFTGNPPHHAMMSPASRSDFGGGHGSLAPFPAGPHQERLSPYGPSYPVLASGSPSPHALDAGRRAPPCGGGGVYDQPWESVADRVPSCSIPLTALGHMTVQNGNSMRRQNGRRVPESLALLNGQQSMANCGDATLRRHGIPTWSDRYGSTQHHHQPAHYGGHPVTCDRPSAMDGGFSCGTVGRGYRYWRDDDAEDFDGRAARPGPAFESVAASSGHPNSRDGGRSIARPAHFHPRTDSSDSCGNSSSSPLVSDAFSEPRRYLGNGEVLDYLSPTSV